MGQFLRRRMLLRAAAQSHSSTWKSSEPEERGGNTVGSPAADTGRKNKEREEFSSSLRCWVQGPNKFQSVS